MRCTLSWQRPAPNGDVLRSTLDNGLRVVIVRDSLAPMVTTQITYLAGGYQTPRGFPAPRMRWNT